MLNQRRQFTLAILLTAAISVVVVVAQQTATQPTPSASKLQQHVSYLASDALQGRRTGTPGANDAAHYIAGEFARLGLQPAIQKAGASRKGSIAMSQYLQKFPYVAGVELGRNNALSLSNGGSFQVGTDWMPLGFAANQKIENAAYTFVGYGITASELNHNDYAVPVKNKIVIAVSGTPDGDNPHGQFARYDGARWKAIAARNAGAAGLLIIAREDNFKDDRLSRLRYDNSASDAGFPVAAISKQTFERMFPGGLGKWLAAPGQATPQATAPGFWNPPNTLSLTTDIVRNEVAAYNVVGILEGSDRTLKSEVIVVGAHYDHLGLGGEGSLAPREGDIHHGADDNASGVAGMLEIARVFASERTRPRRTLVFIGFSGEEEGLLGSNYYVNNSITPLATTVAMINMDMIGRMKDRKLIIGGVGTAKEWRDLISSGTESAAMTVTATAGGNTNDLSAGVPIVVSSNGRTIVTSKPTKRFDLTLQEDGYGPSDHSSFYAKQIPVLFFWTGNHPDYHKPSDTFEKINYDAEVEVLNLVAHIIRGVDSAANKPTYTQAKSDSQPRTGGFRVYLGTIPNYADSGTGLLLDGVRENSPAAKAGLKAGDRVVKIASYDVKNVYDYTYALGELKANEEYPIEVMRGSERLTLKITPEARK